MPKTDVHTRKWRINYCFLFMLLLLLLLFLMAIMEQGQTLDEKNFEGSTKVAHSKYSIELLDQMVPDMF